MGLAWAAVVLVFALVSPVLQSEAYHAFADTRPALGLRNGLNVLSNAPFVLVALLGLLVVFRKTASAWACGAWEMRAFAFVFAATGLVGAGSAYYHLAPDTARLFWDRLPMALVFMAIFAVLVGERIDARAGARAFVPLAATGAAGTLWWRMSGDLRVYGLVQFFPLLALPLLLVLRPGRYDRTRDWVGMAVLYAAAKACEAFDRPIFAAGGFASGHAIKHVLAGAAVGMLAVHVARRRAL